jgi:hypothetical protein
VSNTQEPKCSSAQSVSTVDATSEGAEHAARAGPALGARGGKPFSLERVKLPPGFEIEVYAQVPGARSLALGERGRCSSGTQKDSVYAIVPASDGKREVIPVARGLNLPNGVGLPRWASVRRRDQRILRLDAIETSLRNPPSQVVSRIDFAKETHHGWKVHRVRPRRLALRAGPARLATSASPTPSATALISRYPAGRERLSGLCPRDSQQRRFRLGSAHRRAVVQRAWRDLMGD